MAWESWSWDLRLVSARSLHGNTASFNLTNGADDGTAAELALGGILSVELREPLNSGAASLEVSNCVGILSVSCGLRGGERKRRRGSQGRRQSKKTRRLLRNI